MIERLASAPQAELMPGRRFSVGLTGHRLDRLGAENVARVAAGVAAVLETVERAAPGLAPSDLRLVTGMADGADSIAADAALVRGWTLDAALPFARDDFAADFAPGEHRDAYWRRLSSCGAVMELPGDRNSEDGEGAAYERAGHVVLAQSDILVAVWDGEAARGRGGAAEIVSEAVLRGIPVIHLPSADDRPPQLLWQGLEELDLGQQTRETVARGDLGALPRLIRDILDPPADATSRAMILRFETARTRRWTLAIPYPLLLAVMGVRRIRLSDIFDRGDSDASAPIREICASGDAFAGRVHDLLAPRFAHADTWATRSAQRFRSLYVSNFALAAIAVVLSLTGLALPPGAKPLLITLELSTIAAILFQTRAGNRAAWHRLWLDNRALAERLRCLAISTQLGDLDLRAGGPRTPFWVAWYMHATARELGLPSVRIDSAYLTCVRTDLTTLIDGQVAYLNADARRMHHLEHRLHGLGTILFAMTAFACVSVLAFKAISTMLPGLDGLSHPVTIGATIVGAALPAIGAAIYGIRMQGDFAGIAGRSHALAAQLATLRGVIAQDDLGFDTLIRRVRRVTGLLTEDLASWLQTYDARPLVLPG